MMFQTFDEKTIPETAKDRINSLREKMCIQNIDAFLITRNDAHMGEYVSERDKRLEWLTSFTGSAGYCIVFKEIYIRRDSYIWIRMYKKIRMSNI